MLHRLAATALPLLAVLGTVAPADAGPPADDRLTLAVSDGAAAGTFELRCHPAAGTHPEAQAACDRLDEVTVWGRDPFAPVPADAMCTMQYGGPETARLTGTWAGRPVNARFSRTNGCEIARWNNLAPFLPAAGAQALPAAGTQASRGTGSPVPPQGAPMPRTYEDAHGMPETNPGAHVAPVREHARPGVAPADRAPQR